MVKCTCGSSFKSVKYTYGFSFTIVKYTYGSSFTRLNVHTVPVSKVLSVHTVPALQWLSIHVVPALKVLSIHTVSATQLLSIHTVPASQVLSLHMVAGTVCILNTCEADYFIILSMITPKKLKLSTHSICIPLILTIGNLICFCGFLNIINFDLAELSDNLFTFSQVLISANYLCNILFLLRLLKLANNVVSSACKKKLNNLLEKRNIV